MLGVGEAKDIILGPEDAMGRVDVEMAALQHGDECVLDSVDLLALASETREVLNLALAEGVDFTVARGGEKSVLNGGLVSDRLDTPLADVRTPCDVGIEHGIDVDMLGGVASVLLDEELIGTVLFAGNQGVSELGATDTSFFGRSRID